MIAEALGRRDDFDRTQRRFYAREIGEDEHLENMLRIAEGARLESVEAALAATPKLDRIAEGIDRCHRAGTGVALLTHNPPYVCEWYRRTFGFDDYEGTGAQPVAGGVIGPPRDVRADKPRGLARLVDRTGGSARTVVHIGDGWADAALFPLVGRGVALNSRLPEVERAADVVLHTQDFDEVARTVGRLAPRP